LTGSDIRKHAFRKEFADEREAALRSGDKLDRKRTRIARRLRDMRSGLPTPRVRRSPDEDDAIFNAIKRAIASGDTVRITARTGGPVSDMREAKRRKRIIDPGPASSLTTTGESIFWVPSWDHAGDKLKALSWGAVMYEAGAYAFSLHLSPEVIKAAKSAPQGFAGYMRDRLALSLRRAGIGAAVDELAPDFFFSVEAADLHEPHLHGAIIAPEPRLNEVRAALKKAGGAWRSPHRQLDLTQLRTPARWVGYISKWRAVTARIIGDKRTVAATTGLRRRAKLWYQDARATERPIS